MLRQLNQSYIKLKELINNQELTIYYELSLPRSNSTAWQIAICEAPEIDGQINEASFHSDFKSRHFDAKISDNDRSFEDYCAKILERLYGNQEKQKVGLYNSTQKRHVGLVLNELVHSVNKEELQNMLDLTTNFIITIRDPRIQGLSALTRVMNDTLDSPGGGNISSKMSLYLANSPHLTDQELLSIIGPGKDKINPAQILKFLKEPTEEKLTSELLFKAITQAINRCKEDYLEICWNNLAEQLVFIQQHAKANSKIIIIDGSDLTKNPTSIMQQSAKLLDLTYTPAMIDKWQKANLHNFYCCVTEGWGELAIKNHWNGPVRNSTKLEVKPESITEINEINNFPSVLRTSLETALQIYRQISKLKISIESPCTISKKNVFTTGTKLIVGNDNQQRLSL